MRDQCGRGRRPKALILGTGGRTRVRRVSRCPELRYIGALADQVRREFHPPLDPDRGTEDAPRRHAGTVVDQPEYAYARMAREAGIDMPDTHLLRDGEFAHFMVRRFDRVLDAASGTLRRLHFHSLGGLQHIDFNDQYVFSYEGWFDTIRAIGLGQRSVNEAFRRMVFHVATVNFDDHVKNFGFLMNRAGRWRLAPAYDVTYAENDRWTRQHQMSVRGKFRGITRGDLLEVGEIFDVPGGGREIVAAVEEAVGGWREQARAAGVPGEMVEWVEGRVGIPGNVP